MDGVKDGLGFGSFPLGTSRCHLQDVTRLPGGCPRVIRGDSRRLRAGKMEIFPVSAAL